MSWMQMAQARFSQKAQGHTDKTAKTPLSSVLSVPSGRILQFPMGVSSVSSVGVVGIFENCIPVEELLQAAMCACDHWGDSPQAREQMRREILEAKPEHRAELLRVFKTDCPAPGGKKL